jgi:NTE family protein
MTEKPRRLNLALQGGGSHGAFAWGLLDALLEDEGFEIASITSSSAGSMNAVVCAEGLRKHGRAGAREALDAFWTGLSRLRAPFSPVSMNDARKALDPLGLFKDAAFKWFDLLTSVASPYEFNPWNYNPLREHLGKHVDFRALAADPPLKLFIAATRVSSGTVRVFRERELAIESVLASACLPYVFQAVEIDGEAYWDGGYVANPALFPIFYEDGLPEDVLICWINPLKRSIVPRDSASIMDRMNEINFNSALLAELRSISFVQTLLADEVIASRLAGRYRNVHIHAVEADVALAGLPVSSKFDTSPEFLARLKAEGCQLFQDFAARHRDDVGVRSSVDVRKRYLDL